MDSAYEAVMNKISSDEVLSLAISLHQFSYETEWDEIGAPAVVEHALEHPDPAGALGLLASAARIEKGRAAAYRGMSFGNMMSNLNLVNIEDRWPSTAARELISGLIESDPELKALAAAWEVYPSF